MGMQVTSLTHQRFTKPGVVATRVNIYDSTKTADRINVAAKFYERVLFFDSAAKTRRA